MLVPNDECERPEEHEYDDSPWTREEVEGLAWEITQSAGWEEMDEHEGALKS